MRVLDHTISMRSLPILPQRRADAAAPLAGDIEIPLNRSCLERGCSTGLGPQPGQQRRHDQRMNGHGWHRSKGGNTARVGDRTTAKFERGVGVRPRTYIAAFAKSLP